jgi:membrane dipeptidase
MPATVPIFDGHNDVLLRLVGKRDTSPEQLFLDGENDGHLDLPRAVKGGFGGGIFAIFVPSRDEPGDVEEMMKASTYDVPLPKMMSAATALPPALSMASILFRIERASQGRFKICRTAAEIRDCFAKGVIAAVLHIEGAEPIDASLQSLETLYAAGLRSLGPVWSRPNIFGHGVPFRYPSTPDTGPGLTDQGKDLIRRCNELRIAVDLSHLNEQGFWDTAKLSKAPLIASHSNVHAISPHSRNLTDRQLHAIRDSGGLVGLNFATCFLRPDGRVNAQTELDVMLRHIDHLIQHLGVDGVGFGSDFDGAVVPAEIGDVAGLPSLRDAMIRRGFTGDVLRKLCHENWIGVLERTWGA